MLRYTLYSPMTGFEAAVKDRELFKKVVAIGEFLFAADQGTAKRHIKDLDSPSLPVSTSKGPVGNTTNAIVTG